MHNEDTKIEKGEKGTVEIFETMMTNNFGSMIQEITDLENSQNTNEDKCQKILDLGASHSNCRKSKVKKSLKEARRKTPYLWKSKK